MANEAANPQLSALLTTLRARSTADAPPLPQLAPVRQVDRAANLAELFTLHATRAGMTVRACSRTELAAALVEELRAASVESAILAIEESSPVAVAASAARSPLGTAGVRVLDQPGDEAWFSAAAGITTVQAAVAETGSLLVTSSSASPRSASLIPPIHVALAAASQIVPDLIDAFALPNPHDLPAAVTLISGPSKTADIEGVLVTGVHGPGRVCIILVIDA
jgi:L-lactate dehydrogenase complex protein LldG